ncbi:5-oxoprolinase/urea amidolyase family protein [Bacillus lacus]|uniref:5-oxoprolinase/urea amidolyase family protein n=1 Tax=Metabacillus lacus TaxID=1983721 RepID=A0A7X2M0G8_9BACI|nr:biotin-dependent carboxyltransferase family protein [Metabacillus lacus]MRX74123.1 5-oxoprolinase/urea amidolyase family protein [Metabacillus lacus]
MIKIIRPGLLTSIQDLGRYGYQKYGVIASGAMDQLSHRIANLLAGNDENEPAIEITLMGPLIEFQVDAFISICGGDLSPSIDGKPVRTWRLLFVKSGSRLSFGAPVSGSRAYLAVSGGLSIEKVMNSRSTYLRAEIGGYEGRPLEQGDILKTRNSSSISPRAAEHLMGKASGKSFAEMEWTVAPEFLPALHGRTSIRVLKGRQHHLFSESSRKAFFSEHFAVTPQSDRMGSRLKGASLELSKPQELISEAVSFGTIQVPAEGNPIVLLADRQTTGGYPKIGQIASVDLPVFAQTKPGDEILFREISHEEAQQLYLKREQELKHLKHAIRLKLK